MLGPHLNASGRLETAQLSLDLLTATDSLAAVEIAYKLRELNEDRRAKQAQITKQALAQAQDFKSEPVLVLSHSDWSHGIVGIVAAKILESQCKPTFVLQEIGEESKGSARSFGDFSAVDAINNARPILMKGGGHKLAAGVTLKTTNIPKFRQAVNDYYRSLNLKNQLKHFDPKPDALIEDIAPLNNDLMATVKLFEPFGNGNPEPVFYLNYGVVQKRRLMGRDESHIKLDVADKDGNILQFIGFGIASECSHDFGDKVQIWFKLLENEWNGKVSLEGQIIKITSA